MNGKIISIKDLSKLCGKSKKSTFDVLWYLSKQENPVTIKELAEGVGYGKKSSYIHEIVKYLTELDLIEKKGSKRPFRYKISHKRITIDLERKSN